MNKFAALLACLLSSALHAETEKPIVVIVPSYNNAQWCTWNVGSVIKQAYKNFTVLYVDDCSSDGTADLVEQFVHQHNFQDRFTLVRNRTRKGALHNLYDAIHTCPDDAIIVLVDGDDALARPDVLKIINAAYASDDVWLTYGQYVFYPECVLGCCQQIPENVVRTNSFRTLTNIYSHLRTFYAGLFKRIKKEDLMHEGAFFQMTWDTAMMLPMLEMAGERFKFIAEPIYLYNTTNPLSDFRIDRTLQVQLEKLICSKNPYDRLESLVSN